MMERLAKRLMTAWPAYPSSNDYDLSEIFSSDEYTLADAAGQDRLKLLSARSRYEYEKTLSFFHLYFPGLDKKQFRSKSILDLGSFTGGRLVSWVEHYGFGEAAGIDIDPLYAEAGRMFASTKGLDIAFTTGFAEELPYEGDRFDFVTSYDVFEHVRDVSRAMAECFRVLKPGGQLFAVFPQFFQPLEAHLGLITKMPALQWFFSGRALTAAYHEIGRERGHDAAWYARKAPELEPWERLPTLNGITVAKFRRIIKEQQWHLVYRSKRPLPATGRRAQEPVFRLLRGLLAVPARLPILEELFLDRICCVLEKKG